MRLPALVAALLAAGCAHQERPRPVERTRDGLVVRRAQFRAPPEPEPIEVEGQPEPIDAVEEFFNGRGSEPVFGGGPRERVTDERACAAIDRIVDGATLRRRYPDFQEHHLFPRQLRREFAQLQIDVDEWTILVDPRKHAEAHSQSDVFGPGGRWNEEWRTWLLGFRTGATEEPAVWDALEKAARMIETYHLQPYGLLAPYGCGRIIAHDLYDIVAPPRGSRP